MKHLIIENLCSKKFNTATKQLLVINSFVLLMVISATAQDNLPADKQATPETIHLYRNLKKSMQQGIMFGHQDDYAYGVNWEYQPGRSDVQEVTGDYPAVLGCEIGRIELGWNKDLDGVPFDSTRHYIQQAYARGSVITISWHLNNLFTGKTAWDSAPGTVEAILPGGVKHHVFTSWLDKVAAFMQSLKGEKGEYIPVIFRPFHELNGSWFWWGKNHCTPDELKNLYQFTEHYLRDVKGVHSLLYAFNTDRFATKEEYMERYPGDDWVDIIGFDIYQQYAVKTNDAFIADLDKGLTTLEAIAKEHNKIPALTEFGYNTVPDSTWWTNVLWQGLKNHQIAYVLAWRNAGEGNGETEYWVPYPGQQSAGDFVKFYQLPHTLFAQDVAALKMYQ